MIAPSAKPENTSRRTTRDHSASVTSPRANARTIKVAAWEPELPPLEIMSGTNRARTSALLIWSEKKAHGCRGKHFADKQNDQPSTTLTDQVPEWR